MTTSKTISTTVHGYKFAAADTSLTVTATGKITGSGATGSSAIYGGATRAGETILNLGAVSGASYLYGVFLKDGAAITNGSATDTAASISASQVGVKITGLAGTITNFGSIHGATKGIVLNAGGAVTNGSAADTTAHISGQYAVGINYGAGRVTNFGTIQGQVGLYGGGVVTNEASGEIIDANAIYIAGGAGTLTNLGTISGAVHVASGQVVNGGKTDHAAFIGSGAYGVYLGAGTLTNYGTIGGSNDSVALQSGSVMIAEAGSKLTGPAGYGQGATLVFGAGGGAGTISGLGTGAITGSTTEKFRDLQKYEIEAGARWTLSGTTNKLKAGDSLKVLGTLSLVGSLEGAGTVSIATTGTIKAATAGSVAITTAVANAGLLIVAGGTMTLDKAVTGAGSAQISKGALVAAGTFNENVKFTGATGRLELDHSLTYAGKVSGFSHTGTTSLDLRDIHFVSASEAKFSGVATGGTLTVSDGTHTARIKLVGNYTGLTFKAASDGHGGTTVVDVKTPSTPHFVAAMAAMGAVAGGPSPPKQETAPTATLLAPPRA